MSTAAVKMYTTAVCPYCIRDKSLLKHRGRAQIEEILRRNRRGHKFSVVSNPGQGSTINGGSIGGTAVPSSASGRSSRQVSRGPMRSAMISR